MIQRLSIIIPCYNEESAIRPFMEAMRKEELKLVSKLKFEYYFIDDGSKDETLSELRQISIEKENINYISLSRNFGKEAALLAGLEACTGDFVAVMDVDLQDPPELISQMFEKIQEGFDVVGTRRANRKGEPLIRSIFAKGFYWLINKISETEIVDGVRDFRLMTRQVVESILELQEVNRFSKGLFSWVGYRVTYISFENRERTKGTSSWSFWTLLKYSFEGIINFSDVLLGVATWSGVCSFQMSMIGALFIIVRKLTVGGSIEGWASLVTIILFIGGIQLLSIGVLGKYVSKIFLETKKRPHYIVKEKSNARNH